MGDFSEPYPNPETETIYKNIRQRVRENWAEQQEFMFSIGGQTPEQYAQSLEGMARQYEE